MKSSNPLLEEIIIGTIFISVVCLYCLGILYGWLWSRFLTPILAALLIGLFFRFRTYWNLKNLSGDFDQFDLDNNPIPHKETNVTFKLRNLLHIQPSFFITQKSEKMGDWKSHITISGINPLNLSGIYKYTKSGSKGGGKKGDWGVHSIHINPHEEIIHVKTINKNRDGIDQFLLKKEENQ